ncbi:MAG TPA: ABC transporter ATP-binding protein [Candidatus Cybelea sp.]|nr:ABC transporter ATP-binding protein [Candidatus Cybelea sp.]
MIEFSLKLWQLTRAYKGRFALGVMFSVLSGLAEPVVLLTVAVVAGAAFHGDQTLPFKLPQWAANIYQPAHNWVESHSNSKSAVVLLVSLIPLVMLARGLVNYLSAYMMNWVGIRAICDLRARLFEHLLNQPLSFLSRNSTGELMSRIGGDIGLLQIMIGVSVITLISSPINIVAYACALFVLNAKFTLIAMVTLPLCVIPVAIYNRKVRKSAAAIQSEAAGLNRVMHESFTGVRVIKGYNLEKIAAERFRASQGKFVSHSMRVVRATESPGPIIEVAGAIGVATLMIWMHDQISLNAFLLFVVALLAMYKPIKALVRLQSDLHRARAATARVFELLATQSTLQDPAQPVPLQAAGGDIHFDNVSFAYENKPVLRDIQLCVQPGEKVALVGKSGSGKTTLANLLLRFYDPTSGAIRIGGVDLRAAAVRDLRRQMAVVTQEVILFDDTIRNNIAFGRSGATNAEIEDAARHAFAHDFIMEKPLGYDSIVGEKGTNLSVGQRQRITIARALLRNAPILVLDEATSALDNESERIVQAALDELMKSRTTICIAHRLSTIQNFDRIVVLDAGQIVETGSHALLLAQGGIYAKLYALGATLDSGIP